MSYRIRTDNFEGPFDLLLYLVSRQRVDIGSVSIAEIADQYLAEIAAMNLLDLDVASDFLLVASTLLEIKAESLLPKKDSEEDEEIDDLSPSQARDMLVHRLLEYKQYKNASADLFDRLLAEGKIHRRCFGPDENLLTLMPDYLVGQTTDSIAQLAVEVLGRKDHFLLDSEHIASKPISLERHIRSMYGKLKERKTMRFSAFAQHSAPSQVIVVTFLAVLELYKRGNVRLVQTEPFGDIDITYVEGSDDLSFDGESAVSSDRSA